MEPMLTRLWRWIARLWRVNDPALPVLSADDLAELRRAIAPPFDWLKEYGRFWSPESKAFWIAPTTPKELADWYGTYRPGEEGIKEAYNPLYGPVRIEIKVAPPEQLSTFAKYIHAQGQSLNAYQNAQYASAMQQYQNHLNRSNFDYYGNSIKMLGGSF